ncbi:hypothetical protein LINGRAPRIM_LOCUS1221, partial [Linum grandiflorum]
MITAMWKMIFIFYDLHEVLKKTHGGLSIREHNIVVQSNTNDGKKFTIKIAGIQNSSNDEVERNNQKVQDWKDLARTFEELSTQTMREDPWFISLMECLRMNGCKNLANSFYFLHKNDWHQEKITYFVKAWREVLVGGSTKKTAFNSRMEGKDWLAQLNLLADNENDAQRKRGFKILRKVYEKHKN